MGSSSFSRRTASPPCGIGIAYSHGGSGKMRRVPRFPHPLIWVLLVGCPPRAVTARPAGACRLVVRGARRRPAGSASLLPAPCFAARPPGASLNRSSPLPLCRNEGCTETCLPGGSACTQRPHRWGGVERFSRRVPTPGAGGNGVPLRWDRGAARAGAAAAGHRNRAGTVGLAEAAHTTPLPCSGLGYKAKGF